MRRLPLVARLGASTAAVALVTALLFQFVKVNPTTVALSYVIVILLLATRWGIAEATTASLTAVLCLNFFFLPPIGTLTIGDPQNWVALVAFLVTGLVASQLSGRARERNLEAVSRQRDLERLYALSRSLLLSETGTSIQQTIAQRIAETFDIPAVALYDERADLVTFGGHGDLGAIEGRLRDVARQSTSHVDGTTLVVAVRLGGMPIGSLALSGQTLTDTVLQSVVNLAAIGLERARAQESANAADAARHSGELRATVLDALAHEFKTPLTSMRMAAGELQSSDGLSNPRDRELVDIVAEDQEYLQALINDAIQMIRVDAGDFVVRREPHDVAALIAGVLRKLERRLQGHQITAEVPNGLTVDADAGLLSLALHQLLDNAVKYSPPNSTIVVTASGTDPFTLAVRNAGTAIPDREQARLFDRFYRGVHQSQLPGTGMGLSIVQQIARAHGGAVSVSSPVGGATTFTLSLPRHAEARRPVDAPWRLEQGPVLRRGVRDSPGHGRRPRLGQHGIWDGAVRSAGEFRRARPFDGGSASHVTNTTPSPCCRRRYAKGGNSRRHRRATG